MMGEREDWFGLDEPEEEDPSTSSGDLRADTDEFGRDDPAAIERERRRREREERRRQGGGKGREPRGKRREPRAKGERGGLFKRRPRRRKAPPERPRVGRTEQPPTEAQPPPEPTQVRPAAPEPPTPDPAAAAENPPGAEPPAAEPAATRSAATALRRRGSRSGRGNYRRRRIAFIVLGLLGILLIWFLVALFQPFSGDGQGQGSVSVKIADGAGAGEIADQLAEAGVVSNATLFEIRLRLAGKAEDINANTYILADGMSYGAAIDRLTGEAEEPAAELVLLEGLSRDQYAPEVAEAGITGDYLAASKGSKGFDPGKYGAPKGTKSLEGFLFPATYPLAPGETAGQLVSQQLDAFRANLKKVDLSYAKRKGNLTAYDVLIIASMIEREVVKNKERPLVAAVIWNRLGADEPLAIDATTRYEFKNYTEPITKEQLASDSPFNTRIHAGLPPTPIGNPGLASIRAAANPAKVNFRFYVVDPDSCNGHSFTAREGEFEKLVAKYNAAREANDGQAPSTCPNP